MIQHIVFWKLHGDHPEVRRKAIDEFRIKAVCLKENIPQLLSYHIAENEIENAFHLCLIATFNNLKELDEYINHPKHLEVREFMNSVSYDKTVFDYEF